MHTKTLVTTLGNIGTLRTVVQTFEDSGDVHYFQTLTLNNSNETSVIDVTNSNPEVPLIGEPEDVVELDILMQFLTSP